MNYLQDDSSSVRRSPPWLTITIATFAMVLTGTKSVDARLTALEQDRIIQPYTPTVLSDGLLLWWDGVNVRAQSSRDGETEHIYREDGSYVGQRAVEWED